MLSQKLQCKTDSCMQNQIGKCHYPPTPPQVRGIVHTTVLEIHRRHTRISIFLKFNNIIVDCKIWWKNSSLQYFFYTLMRDRYATVAIIFPWIRFVSNSWSKYPHYAYDLHLESNNYCRKGSLGSSFLHKSMKNIIMDGDWLAMTSCYPGSGKKISVKRFTKTRKATDYSSFKLTLTLLWPWVC